ncbi:MAG: corrinoid protein [Deltaproteobacteria bacterium]|jgi:corrinoid protein of di/trimethylamine methyltransferase|nr:corrinoid protein [Deltaproteobacteria bacterium]
MEELFEKMAEVLIAGKEAEVKSLTQEALDKGAAARDILDKGLLAGMDVVGQRFKAGDMFIPEVLLCARCMHGAMDILNPLLSEGDAAGVGTYLIGTVEGDLHDIGKNLVSMMLEGAGFQVIDLGTNITAQQFVEAVKEHQPDILGMSALLTTTMPRMEETIQALKEAGIRDQVKIMAGGAPVTQDFVDKIGGDAYGANAASATEKAKELLS